VHQRKQAWLTVFGGATVARTRRPLRRKAAVAADISLVSLTDPLRTPSVHRSGSESVAGHRNVAWALGMAPGFGSTFPPDTRLRPLAAWCLACAALCS
jgi:hypothetical protein